MVTAGRDNHWGSLRLACSEASELAADRPVRDSAGRREDCGPWHGCLLRPVSESPVRIINHGMCQVPPWRVRCHAGLGSRVLKGIMGPGVPLSGLKSVLTTYGSCDSGKGISPLRAQVFIDIST